MFHTFCAAKLLLFFDICKYVRVFSKKKYIFVGLNLHISKKYCTFAPDFLLPVFPFCLSGIYSQIRLARHYRERIGLDLSRSRKGGKVYLNTKKYGKSNTKQEVQEIHGRTSA